MKKKLLFVMDTFPLGGISKSLLALFNELDEEKYEIDFLLMKREGFLLPLLPRHINILDEPIGAEYRNPHPKFIIKNLRSLPFSSWLAWLRYSLYCSYGKLTGGLYKQVQCMDKYIARHARPQAKQYDAAIAYQGGRCIYYIAEQVKAKKKIGYVHSDYSQSQADYMLKKTDLLYFPMMDSIVTVSERCLEALKKEFPDMSEKFLTVENICSVKTIRKMAQEGDSFVDENGHIRIVTMGRIDIETKGLDFAVDACKILSDKGYRFKWYFVGDGLERERLEDMIRARGVSDKFIILGAKTNPYPFIKDCDIYAQPSRFEGKSVALDEVKALHKAVVVTDFSTVFDQFTDNKTALIAKMTPESVAEKIAILIDNKELRDSLELNLLNEKVGNEEQLELFEALI